MPAIAVTVELRDVVACRRSWRRGFALLEIILAIVILSFIGGFVAREVSAGNRMSQARMLGTRWTQLTEAADAYIRGNDARLRTVLTDASIVATVPMTDATTLPMQRGLPSFRTANVLGSSFVDGDGFGNRAVLYIFTPPATPQNPTPTFEAFLVSSGGRRIPDDILNNVTGFSEARVGVALAQNPAGQAGATLRGFRGGWAAPLSTFGSMGGTAPPVGSIASYVSLQKGAGAVQSRYLSRVDTGNPVDNLMETNVDMGDQGLNNLSHMQAGSSGTITASGNLQVQAGPGGSQGDVSAAGTVTGGRGVFTEVTPGTPAQQAATAAPGLSVAGVVKAGNLSATNIDVDSFVYSAAGARTFRAGVRLRDLLPQIVHKASYVSSDNQIVPKPTDCQAGEGRVFIYPQVIENASDIGVTVGGTLEFVQIPIVNDVTVSGASPNYTINVTQSTANVLPQRGPAEPSPLILTSSADPSRFRSVAFAQDNGSFWVINLYSQQGIPSGGTVTWQTVPANTRALVQTACVYP